MFHAYLLLSATVRAVPHCNVLTFLSCRSYMTGSTSTSIWKNYQDGVRTYCGHKLPDGMKKNQKLVENLLTPTTKDRPISAEDIVNEKWMTQEDLDVCGQAALKIFALGQEIASEHGLILVDTKYEFGRDAETGEIMLIDEVHTPDSSRYWLASSYAERIAEGLEPENIDKEFLRLWFRDQQCDPYKDAVLPEAPRDLVLELSRRYITLYEMITWKEFDFTNGGGEETIASAIQSHQ
jgi:phosphoribosylaminoimidazole-succinocarboxamide synthase